MKNSVSNTIARYSVMALPVVLLAGGYLISFNSAAEAGRNLRVMFAEMDANGDGVVTEQEYLHHTADEFTMMPVTEIAGSVSLPENCIDKMFQLDASNLSDGLLPASAMQAVFAPVDADGDQQISYQELAATMARETAQLFLDIDTDLNGFVTPDEVTAATTPRTPSVAEIANETGLDEACVTALGIAQDEAFSMPRLVLDPLANDGDPTRLFIAEYDTDRDGRLTLVEMITE